MAARSTASTRTTSAKAAKTAEQTAPEKEPVKQVRAKDIDIHQYIPVINGFQGMLFYRSKRTGEEFQWERFGDEQEMELQELKNAKASSKGFFEHNWFMFGDEYQWVIDYLGVGAFYKNALKLEEFDEVFTKTPAEIAKIVGGLSAGQKASLGYRAKQLIAENGIDSNRVITALEESLGVQLVER